MKKSRPTLVDVARLAGVSLGSASRALSVPQRVKPKTLEAVQNAVAQLGYIRDGAARALASRRSHTIAAVYPTLNNPIFAHSTHSIQQRLWSAGYQLIIVSNEYQKENELALISATLEKGIDGIIMVGTDHDEKVFNLLQHYKIPYVLTWSVDGSSHPYCVGISNFDAANQLTKLALDNGHKSFGICGGSIIGNERARYRRAGILAAVQEAGLSIPDEWIIERPFSYEGGREAIKHFWQMKNRPSVILFGADLQAMGAIHQCRRLGIDVPNDISIIGFDGLEEAAMMQPALTTTRIPDSEIGTQAANLIIDLLKGQPVSPIKPLKPTIVPGESLSNIKLHD